MVSVDNFIIREKLMRTFNSINTEKFIYICAPAGYGKTIAVRQWMERKIYKNTFISLDEFDNDITRLCKRFCTALQNCQPGNNELRKIASHPAFDSMPDEFAVYAIDALLSDENAYLIFDDLHCLNNEQVTALLRSFFKRMPDNIRIILISRNELPYSFSDLWLKNQLICITADDLCFNREEIISLYKKHGNSVTTEKAEEILNLTGGWAIGIGALLLSGGIPVEKKFTYLEKFLDEHIWQRWGESEREFMIKTAVVGEMTPDICRVLTDCLDSETRLDALVNSNAFISRTERGTYCYHSLFHDFLNKLLERRGEEFIRGLLYKAGYFYLDTQDFHNALNCFIKCEDYIGIEKCYMLLVTNGKEYFFIEKMLSIADLSLLHKVADKFPYIYSHLVWAAFIKGKAGEMSKYADIYYARQPDIAITAPQLILNIILVLLVDFRQPLFELLQMSQTLLINKNPDNGASISTINQNFPFLHRGTRDFSEFTVGDIIENISQAKNALCDLFGEQALLMAECLNAGLLYEQGHLEKAYNHALSANAKINTGFSPETKFITLAITINILDALNKDEQADNLEHKISEMIKKEDAYYLLFNFSALKTLRKLMKGDIKTAQDWISKHEIILKEELYFYRLLGYFTTCRAYITVGKYHEAIILLKKVLILAESYKRPLDIIESNLLLAVSYRKKAHGFQDESMQHLQQAVSEAYKYGYTQLFTKDGAELSGMLRRLQKRMEQKAEKDLVPVSFIKMLYLKTLENKNSGLTGGQSTAPVKYTEKQIMIMQLLCEGKSFKEIAEVRGIKFTTLRSHIDLIYRKLDVTSEIEAITKIKELKILEQEHPSLT